MVLTSFLVCNNASRGWEGDQKVSLPMANNKQPPCHSQWVTLTKLCHQDLDHEWGWFVPWEHLSFREMSTHPSCAFTFLLIIVRPLLKDNRKVAYDWPTETLQIWKIYVSITLVHDLRIFYKCMLQTVHKQNDAFLAYTGSLLTAQWV